MIYLPTPTPPRWRPWRARAGSTTWSLRARVLGSPCRWGCGWGSARMYAWDAGMGVWGEGRVGRTWGHEHRGSHAGGALKWGWVGQEFEGPSSQGSLGEGKSQADGRHGAQPFLLSCYNADCIPTGHPPPNPLLPHCLPNLGHTAGRRDLCVQHQREGRSGGP